MGKSVVLQGTSPMKKSLLFIAFFPVLVLAGQTLAAEPLLDADWVGTNLQRPGVVFLDVRGKREFGNAHIPGAVHTDYGGKKGWRVNKGGVRGLLPGIDYLQALIGGLGVDNKTHVVVVAGGHGAGEMAKAARLYWTFKVLGHDEVSILDGGMTGYFANRANPLAKGKSKPRPKTFTARMNAKLLATAEDVKRALNGGAALIDNRSSDQFLGINKSGSVKRPGTIPGAKNVPGVWLTRNGGGAFRDASAIGKLYETAGAPTEGPAINFCNTGHWASLGWFVSYEILGNKRTRMYDGSLAEWTTDPANPVERRVKLP